MGPRLPPLIPSLLQPLGDSHLILILFLFIGSLLLGLLLHLITPRLPSPLLLMSFLLHLVIHPWTLAPLLLSCRRLMPICYLWLMDFLLHFPAPLLSSPPLSLPPPTVIRTSSVTSLPSLPSPTVILLLLCPTSLPLWMRLFLFRSTFLRCPLLPSSIVCLLRAIPSPSLLLPPSCHC